MCSAEASWPQPSQGKGVVTAISKNGSARRVARQIRKLCVESQKGGAAAKPGWFRDNAAAQPHRLLLEEPNSEIEVAGGHCLNRKFGLSEHHCHPKHKRLPRTHSQRKQ